MSDTQVLWSYPLLALTRRIRRVDTKYAYLVVRDGYVPLRRRRGVLSVLWKYERYKHRPVIIGQYGCHEYLPWYVNTEFSNHDDLSSFFEAQMLKEEYA